MGRSIRVLREELPFYFQEGLKTTNIYSPSIVFKDPIHSTQIHGKSKYLAVARVLKMAMNTYYSAIDFQVLKMHPIHVDVKSLTEVLVPLDQPSHQESHFFQPSTKTSLENKSPRIVQGIAVQWILNGYPRASSLFSSTNAQDEYEGTFWYLFQQDHGGFVTEHVLQRIHPIPSPWLACKWMSSSGSSMATF
jgi:hypothetical protein